MDRAIWTSGHRVIENILRNWSSDHRDIENMCNWSPGHRDIENIPRKMKGSPHA